MPSNVEPAAFPPEQSAEPRVPVPGSEPPYLVAPHPLAAGIVACGLAIEAARQWADAGWSAWSALELPRAGDKRRQAFVAGRMCAQRALGSVTGLAQRPSRGAGGEPVWPDRVHGSITHTGTHAYAAVVSAVRSRGLGIDSEPIVDDAGLQSIGTLCCTPTERSRWLQGSDRHRTATVVFSAKEAAYKAVYPTLQRWIDFDEVEVTHLDPASRTVRIRSLDPALLRPYGELVCRFTVTGRTVHTSCLVPP